MNYNYRRNVDPTPFWAVALFATAIFVAGCASSGSSAQQAQAGDEEAVDVGYGSVDRDGMVSSVATVDGDDNDLIQPRSVADMLRGRVAGVTVIDGPGGSVQIRIRGRRSFNSSSEPLYVIDGLIINMPDGILTGINPNDIDSISVLKDAGATAAYGSRGANGVVVIKTKRGGTD